MDWRLIYTHCLVHRIELAFKDAVNVSSHKQYEKTTTLLLGIYYIFRKSTKQKRYILYLRVFVYTVSYMSFALYVYIITFVLFCQNSFIKLLLKNIVLLVYNPKPKSICICTHSAIYVFCLICLNQNIFIFFG